MMLEPDGPLIIDVDDNEGAHEAFVLLRLHEQDVGHLHDRVGRPEYISRKPKCVEVQNGVLSLELFNIGNMASDLITVDYQLIYCTLPSHGVADAFFSSHAQEVQSTSLDRIATASYVEPHGSAFVNIVLPPPPPGLANIYFRARASTLWDAPSDMNSWDFAADRKVTEFHLRVAP
jgi:hypothetical protein